jgi:NACalpha-BTF3-like transcription factor
VISRDIDELKGVKIDRKRLFEYIRKNGISHRSYNDYIKALKKLNYDLADTKNIFPHDFKSMHDLRIAEYDSVIAKEDAEKNKELYHNFEARAQEAKRFEYQGENYVAIIPAHIQELIREGRTLSHCVGRMGYDKKMADGKVIIVFIRSLLDISKPLVTVEYSLERKMILQSHGDFNRSPTDEESAFIAEWEKRTTEILKVA